MDRQSLDGWVSRSLLFRLSASNGAWKVVASAIDTPAGEGTRWQQRFRFGTRNGIDRFVTGVLYQLMAVMRECWVLRNWTAFSPTFSSRVTRCWLGWVFGRLCVYSAITSMVLPLSEFAVEFLI